MNLAPEALEAVCPAKSWDDWLSGYGRITAGKLDARATIATVGKHVERLVRQDVIYAELFVSGYLMLGRPVGEAIAFYEKLRDGVDAAAAGRIQIELLACFGRKGRPAAEAQFARAIELHRRGLICGLSYAGDYAGCTVASVADLFAAAHATGMGIEIHAGETRGPECVWDALEHGRPHRIGHGLAVFRDERLVERVLRDGIHLEFCPTSNLILTDVGAIERHPIVRARELGVSFGVSTDDPAPFGCSMESEYALLETRLGFGEGDFARMLGDARAASFAGRGGR